MLLFLHLVSPQTASEDSMDFSGPGDKQVALACSQECGGWRLEVGWYVVYGMVGQGIRFSLLDISILH
jgi:hypothetical protein